MSKGNVRSSSSNIYKFQNSKEVNFFNYLLKKLYFLNKKVRYFIPIFPWRVFTPDITDTFMNIKIYSNLEKNQSKNYSWQNRPRVLKIIPIASIVYRESLWKILSYASESIVQTTIANGFKNNPKRAIEQSIRYINSILAFIPNSSIFIELDFFQYDCTLLNSELNPWIKRLTISSQISLDVIKNKKSKFVPVSDVTIKKHSEFKSNSIGFDSSYFLNQKKL